MSSKGKPKLAPKAPLIPLHSIIGLDLSSLPLSASATDGSEDESPPSAKRAKNIADPIERERRRKIRNRIASQNSRDKKKKQVEDLELKIAQLERLNQKLINENQQLKEKTSFLQLQNATFQQPVGEPNIQSEVSPCTLVKTQSTATDLGTVGDDSVRNGASRSAALGCVSLQQELPHSRQQSRTLTVSSHKKYPTWIKLLLMMSLIESLPSSVILTPKTLSSTPIRKASISHLVRYLRAHQQQPHRHLVTDRSNRLLLLSALRWWKAHNKAWTPPKK